VQDIETRRRPPRLPAIADHDLRPPLGSARALADDLRDVAAAAGLRAGGRPGAARARLSMSVAVAKQALMIFAKEPTPGRVKTRLAAAIGAARAAQIYRDLTTLT